MFELGMRFMDLGTTNPGVAIIILVIVGYFVYHNTTWIKRRFVQGRNGDATTYGNVDAGRIESRINHAENKREHKKALKARKRDRVFQKEVLRTFNKQTGVLEEIHKNLMQNNERITVLESNQSEAAKRSE